MTQHVDKPATEEGGVSRRTLVKGAAWSVPVIAVAIAAPSAAASTTVLSDFSVDGTCGDLGLGLIGAGVEVSAGSAALPVGTTITMSTSGVLTVDVFDYNNSLLSATVLGGDAVYTLIAPLAAGATLSLTALLNVDIGNITGNLALPTGYTAGPGSKSSGGTTTVAVLCRAV